MRRTPFSAIGPLDSDAMDTANAHKDTIDETADLLEQEAASEEIASDLPEREPATDDEAPRAASQGLVHSPRPTDGAQRLSTPAAGWVATAIDVRSSPLSFDCPDWATSARSSSTRPTT